MSRVIISVVVLFSLFPTWCCLASLSKQIGHRFAMILFSDLVEQAWQACGPFVVEQVMPMPMVIFASKHWRRSRRLGKKIRLVLCAINILRGPVAGAHRPHFFRLTVTIYCMLGKLSTMVAYCIISVYVHVVRPSFASSVQLLSINLWLPQGAINTPILGLHIEATKQVFRSNYWIFISKSSGLLSRLPRHCIDNSFWIALWL